MKQKLKRSGLIIGILIITIGLSGCCSWKTDQEKRIELFNSCLENIPKGPETTHYNDWDEVVSSCDNVSYYQARSQVCY